MEIQNTNLGNDYKINAQNQKQDKGINLTIDKTDKKETEILNDSLKNQKLKSGSALAYLNIGLLIGAKLGSEKKDSSDISLKESLIKNFKTFDKNNSGFITLSEVKKLISDPNIKGEKAINLAILSIIMSDKNNEKLSFSDLSKIDTSEPIFKSQSSNKLLSLEDIKINMENKLKATDKYKKTDGNFQLPKTAKELDFKEVKQGYLGDCYLLATLSSFTKQKPESLLKMVKDNNDGTYTVNINGSKIKTPMPTDTELALGAEGQGIIPIIEKAYALYQNKNSFIESSNPYDKISSGRTTLLLGKTIKELTGSNYDTDLLEVKTAIGNFNASSKNETIGKIQKALKENKLIIASAQKNNSLNIAGNHAYSVIGFDPKTNSVEIRNPWGKGDALDLNSEARDGNNDGIFRISLEEFYKTFNLISYEK
ncbi:MAG: C2 family cysteine protease [Candidatus Sericytochromatia bacterium]